MQSNTPKTPWEISQWSCWLSNLGVQSVDMHEWMAGEIKAAGPAREDISTFFDLLDLDDYASYGGKA